MDKPYIRMYSFEFEAMPDETGIVRIIPLACDMRRVYREDVNDFHWGYKYRQSRHARRLYAMCRERGYCVDTQYAPFERGKPDKGVMIFVVPPESTDRKRIEALEARVKALEESKADKPAPFSEQPH